MSESRQLSEIKDASHPWIVGRVFSRGDHGKRRLFSSFAFARRKTVLFLGISRFLADPSPHGPARGTVKESIEFDRDRAPRGARRPRISPEKASARRWFGARETRPTDGNDYSA